MPFSTALSTECRVSLRGVVLALAIAFVSACGSPGPGAPPLGAFAAVPDAVTVSGVSAGGYMAGQFHAAYSEQVSGLGIIAAGPWFCAQGELAAALGACIDGDAIDSDALLDAATRGAEAGEIDALESNRDDRVWLFYGQRDEAVARNVVEAAADFYTALLDEGGVREEFAVDAVHGVPTLSSGAPCGEFSSPYLNACDYDAAGAMLAHTIGGLSPRTEAGGQLLAFDQSAFGDASLYTAGYLYVPDACRAGGCKVHVFFHGCQQSAELVGDVVARGAGLNEWAEANRLLVLYPQVAASSLSPMNPLGCWDWWGYTGADYATRSGAQLRAVRAMLERLAEAPEDAS